VNFSLVLSIHLYYHPDRLRLMIDCPAADRFGVGECDWPSAANIVLLPPGNACGLGYLQLSFPVTKGLSIDKRFPIS